MTDLVKVLAVAGKIVWLIVCLFFWAGICLLAMPYLLLVIVRDIAKNG